MDNKLNKVDSIMRFLDSGWMVVMWRNPMGSYSAALAKKEDFQNISDDEYMIDVDESRITDDFTPSKVLERLAEKPLGNIIDNKKGKDAGE